MKILKFKKTSKDKYKLLLDNNESITLYEDVIINNNLLLTKEIDNNTLDKLMKQNNDMYAYSMALNYISIKMRSIKEIKEYLLKKGFNEVICSKTTDKLLKDGYLNDLKFTKSFINDQLNLTTSGPLKIKKELLKYGIKEDIINDEVSKIEELVIKEKLSKLMEKQLRIKKGSLNSLKIKLINYFVNLGYEKDMVINELSKHNLKSDENKLKKDYEKLYNKYKSKYEGSSLLYFISQKLYSKGYTSEDIKNILKENE